MRDIYAEITGRFVEQLKQGAVPWQRPWLSAQNIVSRKPYRGINSLLLGLSRFESPFWMTFRQAAELGGAVKKGAKSSPIIFFKFVARTDAAGRPVLTAKGDPKIVPFIRWANVFNLTQVEGIEAPVRAAAPETLPALERAEAILRRENLCPIRHQGFAAAYSPREDVILMPAPGFFRGREDYYHTAFHEMTHATGHASRLAREGVVDPVRFGSERYSKEELIAELGASFLSNEAGILDSVRFENAAGYLQGWTKKLEGEPQLLVSAASQAQKAVDFVLGRSPAEDNAVTEGPSYFASSRSPTLSRGRGRAV